MSIAESSIRAKTVTLMFVFLIIAGGIHAYQNLGRLEDPEFTIKDALIITRYPGATATEVEEEVTEPLESAIQALGQLKEIKSLSKDGLSIITATIRDKYDRSTLPQVWDELRRKVGDAQGKLPPGAGTSRVNDDFGDVFGVYYAITGDGYSYRELKDYVDDLRTELLLVQDVSKVEIYAAQREVVYVEMTRSSMSSLGVTQGSILRTISQQNLVSESGHARVGEEYIRITPSGEFTSVASIGNLVVRGVRGDALVYLKDVATIRHGYVDPPNNILRFNGQKAIGLGISTVIGGNVVVMGAAIEKRLAELKAQRPVGIELGVISHQAQAVEIAISGFVVSLLQAIAIVLVVLVIFMGFRSAFIIGLVLLLTIFMTFIMMKMKGVMLERISLGALIIALGMLVDNAIVVVEGMMINIQKGMDRMKAAGAVVGQTMWPLFGATIVAILAFGPIGFSPDKTGEYCRSLFLVLFFSLFASWILAITVTPLLCHMLIQKPKEGGGDEDPYKGFVFTTYKAILLACLKFRWITVLGAVGLLVLAVMGFKHVPKSFFPDSTRPQFLIHYWRPEGTDIRATKADLEKIEEHVKSIEGVTDIGTFVGQGPLRFLLTFTPEKAYGSYGLLMVGVDKFEKIDGMIESLKIHLSENYPDSEPKFEKFVLGPGGGFDVEARFSGPDAKVLRRLSEQAKAIYRNDPASEGVRDDWRQITKVVRPNFAEAQARNSGITRPNLATALQMNFSAYTVGLYRDDDKLLPIMLRPPEKERLNIENIRDLQIWSPVARSMIPISQVVSGFDTVAENPIIQRFNRKRTITVQCDAGIGFSNELFKRLRPKIEAIELPPGYELEWGGEFENSQKAQTGLGAMLPLCILGMIVSLICLFNSIKQPLIIMLTVPLAVVGVSGGLLASGASFGFMAILGALSLIGMLIKNAIVLIDEINIQTKDGKLPFKAVVDSSVSRVRPVSMAALTTVLGMIPLLPDVFFSSMAVTVMAGLTFATILTLIMVPVLYVIFYRLKCTSV